jgi:hypothetical protein
MTHTPDAFPAHNRETQAQLEATWQIAHLSSIGYLDHLDDMIEQRPLGGDPRVHSYLIATKQLCEDPRDPASATMRWDLIHHKLKRGQSFEYTWNQTMRALMKGIDVSPPHGFDYYEDLTQPEAWLAAYRDFCDEGHPYHDEFMGDLTREIQSNVVQRYKGSLLAIALMRERYGLFIHPLSVLDIGASHNIGLVWEGTEDDEHESVTVQYGSRPNMQIDVNSTAYLRALLRQKLVFEAGIGVDIVDYRLGRNSEYIKASSFYPTERLNGRNVARFDKLANTVMPAVSFKRVDITKASDIEKAGLKPGSFDVVQGLTVIHQIDGPERSVARDNAMKLLKPNGIYLEQDFCWVDANGNIHYYPERFKGKDRYRMNMTDNARQELGAQELFIWEHGRPNNMQWGLGGLAIMRELGFDPPTSPGPV